MPTPPTPLTMYVQPFDQSLGSAARPATDSRKGASVERGEAVGEAAQRGGAVEGSERVGDRVVERSAVAVDEGALGGNAHRRSPGRPRTALPRRGRSPTRRGRSAPRLRPISRARVAASRTRARAPMGTPFRRRAIAHPCEAGLTNKPRCSHNGVVVHSREHPSTWEAASQAAQQVFWLPVVLHTPPLPSRTLRSSDSPTGERRRRRPVTAAGPRRIHTGFPRGH